MLHLGNTIPARRRSHASGTPGVPRAPPTPCGREATASILSDVEAALARPRNAAERRLAVVSHAAGLLGATVAGWALAAAVSIALLSLAGRRRAPYLALQAGQAALYQLAVLAIDLVGVGWLVVGFIAFAGDIPGLPSIRLDDLGEPIWLSLQVVWALTILAWPVWHVLTLVWAGVGAVRTARGRKPIRVRARKMW